MFFSCRRGQHDPAMHQISGTLEGRRRHGAVWEVGGIGQTQLQGTPHLTSIESPPHPWGVMRAHFIEDTIKAHRGEGTCPDSDIGIWVRTWVFWSWNLTDTLSGRDGKLVIAQSLGHDFFDLLCVFFFKPLNLSSALKNLEEPQKSLDLVTVEKSQRRRALPPGNNRGAEQRHPFNAGPVLSSFPQPSPTLPAWPLEASEFAIPTLPVPPHLESWGEPLILPHLPQDSDAGLHLSSLS